MVEGWVTWTILCVGIGWMLHSIVDNPKGWFGGDEHENK